MKKLLVAISLAFVATSASADIISGGLTVKNEADVTIMPSAGDDGWGGNGTNLQPAGLYTAGKSGALYSNIDGIFTATFLGMVAANANDYVSGLMMVMPGTNTGGMVGSTSSQNVSAGDLVSFSFQETANSGSTYTGSFANGDTNSEFQGFIFLDALNWNDLYGTSFDFLIGYNDTAGVNNDYDDYVVGVKAVPVPAALPLLASALGMFGVARRKSKKAA